MVRSLHCSRRASAISLARTGKSAFCCRWVKYPKRRDAIRFKDEVRASLRWVTWPSRQECVRRGKIRRQLDTSGVPKSVKQWCSACTSNTVSAQHAGTHDEQGQDALLKHLVAGDVIRALALFLQQRAGAFRNRLKGLSGRNGRASIKIIRSLTFAGGFDLELIIIVNHSAVLPQTRAGWL